jgi:hypothetical protein
MNWQSVPDASGDLAQDRSRIHFFNRIYDDSIFFIDFFTEPFPETRHSLFISSPAPGPGTGPHRLGRLPGQPRPKRYLYGYLIAVYGLVSWWAAEERAIDRARRALRLCRLEVSEREDPFAGVIRCTADPAKADKRTRSKWSRVMRYAAAYKSASEPLNQFVRRKGGINSCAARFSRCVNGQAPPARSSPNF